MNHDTDHYTCLSQGDWGEGNVYMIETLYFKEYKKYQKTPVYQLGMQCYVAKSTRI